MASFEEYWSLTKEQRKKVDEIAKGSIQKPEIEIIDLDDDEEDNE